MFLKYNSFFNWLVTFLSISALIISLEVTYHRKDAKNYQLSPKGLFKLDPYLGLSIIPNMNKKEFVFHYYNNVYSFTASTTTGGYQGTHYYPPKRKPDTIRIVADGSSWTFGWNVDDAYSWSAQLEKILKERKLFSQEVEIINAGAPAVGATINRYVHLFSPYEPDLVIVLSAPRYPGPSIDINYYLEPLVPSQTSFWFIDKNGIAKIKVNMNNIVLTNIFQRSYFLRYLRAAYMTRKNNSNSSSSVLQSINEKKYLTQSDECLNYFLDYKKVLNHEHTQLFVALRPGGIESEKVSALLTDKLSQQNVPAVSIVSLIPYTSNYYTFDSHWNEEGNKVAAETIYNLLKENKEEILNNVALRKQNGIIP